MNLRSRRQIRRAIDELLRDELIQPSIADIPMLERLRNSAILEGVTLDHAEITYAEARYSSRAARTLAAWRVAAHTLRELRSSTVSPAPPEDCMRPTATSHIRDMRCDVTSIGQDLAQIFGVSDASELEKGLDAWIDLSTEEREVRVNVGDRRVATIFDNAWIAMRDRIKLAHAGERCISFDSDLCWVGEALTLTLFVPVQYFENDPSPLL